MAHTEIEEQPKRFNHSTHYTKYGTSQLLCNTIQNAQSKKAIDAVTPAEMAQANETAVATGPAGAR